MDREYDLEVLLREFSSLHEEPAEPESPAAPAAEVEEAPAEPRED